MHIAKSKNITTVVIGHVTKEGSIAGPKVLEHMVDTVIYFEGDKYKSFRMLRSMKNRFGNTSEVGIFEMGSKGLKCITNPNELFLNERSQGAIPGSAIIVTNEGTRPLLVEIQALVGTTPYATPRRVTNGVDMSRLHQILAVLEKRVGLNLSKQDVYVNVMGGIDVDEPSADLGIAIAVATCARDVVVDPQTVIIGEIGLSGEIHPVSNIDKRLNEAVTSGFKKAIIPYKHLLFVFPCDIIAKLSGAIAPKHFRVWRSLVSRLNGVQEALSSNLSTRTNRCKLRLTAVSVCRKSLPSADFFVFKG